MSTDIILQALAATMMTYLLHSTLLCGAVWLLERLHLVQSFVVRERLWKFAIVGSVLTAVIQLSMVEFRPVCSFTLATARSARILNEPEARDFGPGDRNTGSRAGHTRSFAPDPSPRGQSSVEHPAATNSHNNSTLPLTITDLDAARRNAHVPNASDTADEDGSTRRPRDSVHRDAGLPKMVAIETFAPTSTGTIAQADGDSDIKRVAQTQTRPDQFLAEGDRTSAAGTRLMGLQLAAMLLVLALMTHGVLRLTIACWCLSRTLKQSDPISQGAAWNALQSVKRNYGIRGTVRLLRSSQLSEPSAFGVRKWAILLPCDIESRLSRRELEALLAHELAHLERRDPLWQIVCQVTTSCLPWQPFNYVARSRLRECSEYLCDRWAVIGGIKPMTLAACLTQIAEWKLSPEHAPGLTATSTSLSGRVELLVQGEVGRDRWRSSRQRRVLEVLLASAIIAVGCFGPRVFRHSANADELVASTAENPDREHPMTEQPRGSKVRTAGTETGRTITRTSQLGSELDAVATELEETIRLIPPDDPDPQIRDIVQRLRQRLNHIRIRANAARSTP